MTQCANVHTAEAPVQRGVVGDGIPDYLDDDDDGDGIPDHLDDDVDGDGIPDVEEEHDIDSDGDGIPDYLGENAAPPPPPCSMNSGGGHARACAERS